jgi:hypothetical protein
VAAALLVTHSARLMAFTRGDRLEKVVHFLTKGLGGANSPDPATVVQLMDKVAVTDEQLNRYALLIYLRCFALARATVAAEHAKLGRRTQQPITWLPPTSPDAAPTSTSPANLEAAYASSWAASWSTPY